MRWFVGGIRHLTPRWKAGPTASRWASIGLGLVLAAVCVLALTGIQQLHSALQSNQRASEISDQLQDARYLVATEDAELGRFRLTGTAEARADSEAASNALSSTLNRIKPRLEGSDAATLATVIANNTLYQRLAAQEFALHDTQRDDLAAVLAESRMSPLLESMNTDLVRLAQTRHDEAATQLHAANTVGTRLSIGTPVVLGLAMFLLGALMLVTRGYRRTVERQAMHDALTGLPNRLLFADRVSQALAAARRSASRPVVMLLDLDRFKEVNDTLGHNYGDELLVQVAARLNGAVRPGDTVARLGGDEFGILLPEGGPVTAIEVAQRLLATFSSTFSLDGIAVGVEGSIGIASAPGNEPRQRHTNSAADTNAAALLREADVAMYAAKADRSGFSAYSHQQDDGAPNRLALLGELRQGMERDELVVHYQPKVALDTGELTGVEALVRWQHPTRGLLLPAQFIDLAEGTTLIYRLTNLVLGHALGFSREWLNRGIRLPVAVNVSPRTLLEPGFAGRVRAQLVAAGLSPNLLCLELTESTIMANPDRALVVLSELHDMGVRLSIDDFGTGYSSMAYLRVLPVDELKIDRSFVLDMTRNEGDRVLVQSAIDLGHNLGLSVVAEGVEDAATLRALKAAGADLVQGYYFARPMAPGLLRNWLEAHDDRIRAAAAKR